MTERLEEIATENFLKTTLKMSAIPCVMPLFGEILSNQKNNGYGIFLGLGVNLLETSGILYSVQEYPVETAIPLAITNFIAYIYKKPSKE